MVTRDVHDRDMKELKFANKLVDDIHDWRKQSTFRYDDEKEIQEGDELRMLTPQDRIIKTGVEVTHVEVRPVREFEPVHFKYHEKAKDVETLVEGLNMYYDDEITLDTEIKFISWCAVWDDPRHGSE